MDLLVRGQSSTEISKGVLARESRTGTRLVSSAAGCEKKMTPPEQGLRTPIEYIRAYY